MILDDRHILDVHIYDVLIQLLVKIVMTSTVNNRRHAVYSFVGESAVRRPCVPAHLVDVTPCGIASKPDDKTGYRGEQGRKDEECGGVEQTGAEQSRRTKSRSFLAKTETMLEHEERVVYYRPVANILLNTYVHIAVFLIFY